MKAQMRRQIRDLAAKRPIKRMTSESRAAGVYTNIRIRCGRVKEAYFVGTAREDLAAFPESARRRAGYELFMVQVGREPTDFKPISDIGPGAYEIRVRDESGVFRVVYVAKFEQRVYVLHAFQKKTRKTSKADLEMARKRYSMIGAEP